MRTDPGDDTLESQLAEISWRGECCIDGMFERKAELVDAIASGSALSIDTSEVTRIDTAGLQLLAACVLELGRSGRVAQWRGTSQAVREAAGLAGLTDLLGLPQG